jgi:basic membrane protein A and related proteins
MKSKHNRKWISIVCILFMSFMFSSCAPAPVSPEPTVVSATKAPAAVVSETKAPVAAVSPEPTVASVTGAPVAAKPTSEIKFAMIIPGPIQDADYNMLGYNATLDVGKTLGIVSEYSEQVAVADAGRVAQEYINRGFNIIGFHGGQFVSVVQDLAPQYPNVTFIAESGGPDRTLEAANIWNIGRRVYLAQYPYGVLAARMTKTKTVAFLGGQKFSNFVSSINTIDQAIAATDPSVKLIYTFTGDQNDAVKGRQGALALMNQNADFLLVNLNGATFGAIEGVKSSTNQLYFSALYTDKSSLAPKNFISSPIYDFSGVFSHIISQVEKGTKSGYYDMKPGNGIKLSPFYNVPADVQKEVEEAWAKVGSGEIKLVEDTSDIKIRK